jgi:hypothetical protein
VVKIFGDYTTERIAVEEDNCTAGGTQAIPQLLPQGCLAGA